MASSFVCKEPAEQNLLHRVLFFVALFLLIVATWRAGGPDFRFQKLAEQVNPLTTSDYPPVWEVRGPVGNIDIGADSITLNRRTDGDCAVLIPVNIAGLEPTTVFRIRADLEIDGNRDLNRRTHYMHFYAIFYRGGEFFRSASLRPGLPQHRHKPVYSILRVPSKAQGMNLVLQCGEAQDSYRLGNLSLETVEFSWRYKLTMLVLLVLWGLVLLGSIWWLVSRVSWKVYLPLALGVGALAAGIGASKPWFVQFLDPLHTWLVGWIPALRAPTLNAWFKLGHLLFFFTIAVVLFLNHQRLRTSVVWLFMAMVMLAFATEAWQMHFFGRSSQFSDVIIDVTGVVLAFILVALWECALQKRAPFTQPSSSR